MIQIVGIQFVSKFFGGGYVSEFAVVVYVMKKRSSRTVAAVIEIGDFDAVKGARPDGRKIAFDRISYGDLPPEKRAYGRKVYKGDLGFFAITRNLTVRGGVVEVFDAAERFAQRDDFDVIRIGQNKQSAVFLRFGIKIHVAAVGNGI